MPRRCDLWRVGIVQAPVEDIARSGLSADMAISWLDTGKAFTFDADPFGVWHDGHLHIFVEYYDYRTRHGVIDRLELDDAFQPLRRERALTEPWHLSYPQVFEADGVWWMLPEAYRSGALTLYRADSPADAWRAACRLDIGQPAIDATIVKYADRWWLFFSSATDRLHRMGSLHAAWADKLVEAIGPEAEDRFLEIGPGPGALTLRLAPRVAHLTAVEVDRDLAAALEPQLPSNVEVVVADFLALDLTTVLQPGPIRVAGNLPYNISSPILFKLIEAARAVPPEPPSPHLRAPRYGGQAQPRTPSPDIRVTDATLMLQREVAERLEARPGSKDYGVLSISVQLHADVRRVLSLPPGAFRPAPQVHSAVVRLTFRPPPAPPRDERVFEAMVRSMFTQRRKTLGNALRPFAEALGLRAVAALEASGIDPSRRPETLELAELTRLADRFAGAAIRSTH